MMCVTQQRSALTVSEAETGQQEKARRAVRETHHHVLVSDAHIVSVRCFSSNSVPFSFVHVDLFFVHVDLFFVHLDLFFVHLDLFLVKNGADPTSTTTRLIPELTRLESFG